MLLLPLLGGMPTSSAVELEQVQIKVAVQFEYTGNINQLRGEYQQLFSPSRDNLVENFGTSHNFQNFDWIVEPSEFAVNNVGFDDEGREWFEIYPEIVIEGSNTQTDKEFALAHDYLVGQLRQELINFLEQTDAFNVYTHLHYSWGSIDIDELL